MMRDRFKLIEMWVLLGVVRGHITEPVRWTVESGFPLGAGVVLLACLWSISRVH